MYASDPDYAERQRIAARETYRKEHPLPPSKLEGGLLMSGQLRELYSDRSPLPMSVESFTVPEAARALGRSEVGFKRWIADGVMPPPVLRDTTRNYRHYSVGELQLIANILRAHEEDFSYLTTAHVATIGRIWEALRSYRATHV